MSYKKAMEPAWQAGYTEKRAVLPDGTTLNYGEGPANGKTPLLLIHGQTGAWQDYHGVLPALSADYHVFAVDCHGHGKSDRTPEKYSAEAIGEDLIWFLQHIAGVPAVVSGHSSGGLLTAWLCANAPRLISGAVLEDPPFFSTIPGGRWERSFAYVDTYEPMHRFLQQTEEKDWMLYYLEHCAWGKFVGEKGMRSMVKAAKKARTKHPDRPVHIFFLPDKVNRMFWFVDDYDLRFGEAFYDSSWFEGFDQEETLKRVLCPAVLIHTKWSVTEEGILMAAMGGDDAAHANELMKNSEIFKIDSGHDSHAEKPADFLAAFAKLREKQGLSM